MRMRWRSKEVKGNEFNEGVRKRKMMNEGGMKGQGAGRRKSGRNGVGRDGGKYKGEEEERMWKGDGVR